MLFTVNKGYAAITVTIFMLVISLTIISAFSFFTIQEINTNRAYTRSVDARYVAEGGIEDATYRIVAQKQIGASGTIGLGNATTTVTVTTSGSSRVIESDGVRDDFQNNVQNIVDITSAGVNFYYGIQVGDGGLTMGNNAVVNGNIYSNGSIAGSSGATITGDATVAGGIYDNPEVQWISDNADQAFATTSASRDIAQSFTATSTGAAPQISVLLAKVGAPSGDITLRLTTDNAGKPSTSDIANTVIKNSVVGAAASWITVAFASPPAVTSGSKYWIVLDYGSNSTTNYWNWRKDTSNSYASNTGRYADNWSSGSAAWANTNSDLAFKVWIGGTQTKIEGVTIGSGSTGTGRANLFVNDTIHGSSCPNAYCIVENPARQSMPISEGVIQDWKDGAEAGGECVRKSSPDPQLGECDLSGNFIVDDLSVALGPKKIPGNLILSNNAHLTLTGTVWVLGNADLSNNCDVRLSSGYGALSGVLLTDGTVDVSNNCTFAGSGQSGSYIMILSDKNAPTSDVIEVSNNSFGVIYYAPNGRIEFSNNATAKEATAYGIDMENGATITYESGLANAQFSSGPSGGYTVRQWREVP